MFSTGTTPSSVPNFHWIWLGLALIGMTQTGRVFHLSTIFSIKQRPLSLSLSIIQNTYDLCFFSREVSGIKGFLSDPRWVRISLELSLGTRGATASSVKRWLWALGPGRGTNQRRTCYEICCEHHMALYCNRLQLHAYIIQL